MIKLQGGIFRICRKKKAAEATFSYNNLIIPLMKTGIGSCKFHRHKGTAESTAGQDHSTTTLIVMLFPSTFAVNLLFPAVRA